MGFEGVLRSSFHSCCQSRTFAAPNSFSSRSDMNAEIAGGKNALLLPTWAPHAPEQAFISSETQSVIGAVIEKALKATNDEMEEGAHVL